MAITDILPFREAAANIWWTAKVFCGTPADMAREGFASRRLYRLMRDWITSLEKLAGRIVYLAALMIDPAAFGPARAATGASERTPPVIPGRRPCLRVLHRRRETAPHARSASFVLPGGDPFALIDDQPVRINHLARRFEAVRHAIWHTYPHALRLARWLARREARGLALPVIARWLKPSRLLTSGEAQIDDHMTAIEPHLNSLLAIRQPASREPECDHPEPG